MLPLYMNIRRLREAKGLSQQELAEATGYTSRSSIAKIEDGKVDLPQSKIVLFAKALNVNPYDLMGLDKLDDLDIDISVNAKVQSRNVTPFGSEEDIYNYFHSQGREDLWHTFQAINNSDTLRILMDGAADLSPEDLEPVLILVQGIRKSKGLE